MSDVYPDLKVGDQVLCDETVRGLPRPFRATVVKVQYEGLDGCSCGDCVRHRIPPRVRIEVVTDFRSKRALWVNPIFVRRVTRTVVDQVAAMWTTCLGCSRSAEVPGALYCSSCERKQRHQEAAPRTDDWRPAEESPWGDAVEEGEGLLWEAFRVGFYGSAVEETDEG